ncbi:transposase [Escherichia coli]|nr:transposase [Escherichia coli]
MSGKRYPEEFKTEAVKQVVDRGYSVASVATRLDITTHSLYAWIKKYGPDSSTNKEQSDAQAEIRRLQKELKRVTDERDILKKAVVDSIGQRNSYVKTWGCGGFLNETNIYSRGKMILPSNSGHAAK